MFGITNLYVNPGQQTVNPQVYLQDKEIVVFYVDRYNRGSAQMNQANSQTVMGANFGNPNELAVVSIPYVKSQDEFEKLFQSIQCYATLDYFTLQQQGVMQILTAISSKTGLHASPSGVALHVPTGNILSFDFWNDLWQGCEQDYAHLKQLYLKRGHVSSPQPLPKGKKNNPLTSSSTGGFSAAHRFPPAAPAASTSGFTLPKPAAAPTPSAATAAQGSSSSSSSGPKKGWPKKEPIDVLEVNATLRQFATKTDFATVGKEFYATMLRVLENVLDKPDEVKFQSIKKTVPKLFADGRPGIELLQFAKWETNETHISMKKTEAGTVPGENVSLHEAIQRFATEQAEKAWRKDRDATVAKELEKEKAKQARNVGGERMNLGAERRACGRGGG